MKKAFDQTVREIKREVNKKVLKVPNIEQKILDATSNEHWGPHGTLLADIAQATRNHHEYQMIMSVIWKRISDTGKNWRHVYKALTVLEYLVGHGSERVIDEIREHAYQISTLSDFPYIDSSGKDQGSNVRRKSQILVALVNDKEKIQEARQKALANKDKYRNSFSTGGSYGPSSYSGGYGNCYDDDRYEGKYGNGYEDQNSYRRERDGGYRDDDRYGRDGDSYNREGDHYGRDPDERSVRDNHKEDDFRGNHGNDDYQFGTRNRSSDRDGVRSFDDDDRYSTRNASARADESSQDERRLGHRLSEPNVGAPPSYEEAARNAQNQLQEERSRNGGTMTQTAAKASSTPAPKAGYIETTSPGQEHAATSASATGPNEEADAFDEFDPRGSSLVPPPVANSLEIDLFGSLSASDSTNSLALMPVTSSTTSEADISANSGFGMNFVPLSSASNVLSQPAENPFGDTPFKAIPQENFPAQQQNFAPATSFQTSGLTVGSGHLPSVAPEVETVPAFDFGDSLGGITYAPTVANGPHSPANSGTFATELPGAQVSSSALGHFLPQTGHAAVISPQMAQQGTATIIQTDNLNKLPQTGPSAPVPSQVPSVFSQTMQTGALTIRQAAATPNLPPQSGFSTPAASQASSSTSGIPPVKAPPSKDKFEPKSTVWADTLSRGLVNLNISGPKINPLADIGIDFESINRMEKRKEKASATPATSTVIMGKAMGSGSGMGRAGASSLVPAPNTMIGSGLGRGMCIGGSPGMGMSMGAYGGSMNGPIGTGMGMGMGMGMAMNMGVGQAAPMRTPTGMAPGPGMPGVGYNPMMGMGSYGSQQPYRGGY